jgi:hypothetical protein
MKGSRVVDGRSCSALAAAIVVILALAADPYALTEPAAAPGDESSAPRPALEPSRAPHFDADAPAPGSSIGLKAGVVLAGDWGTITEPTFGAGLMIAGTSGPLRLEMQGTTWSSRSIESTVKPGVGGVIGFNSLVSRVCLGTGGRVVSIGGCGGLEVVWAHGQGLAAAPANDSTAWAALELGLWLRQVSSERINAYGGVTAGIPLRRPGAEIIGVGEIERPFIVRGQATVGFDVKIF